jgi:hypothetical protein
VLDDQRVRLRDVDPRLDDRRAHQHVRAAAQVVHHHLLELALAHLPVRDREAHARAQRAQPLGGLVDRLDAVVQEERLPAALVLAHDRPLDELLLVLAHIGLHRAAALRRRLDHEMSRSPASDICSVRGIGVALIEITSTFSFSWRRAPSA